MTTTPSGTARDSRDAPLDIPADAFRALGYRVVDRVAELLEDLPARPVTPGELPADLERLLGAGPLPAQGAAAEQLMEEAMDLLFAHSLFNGHPRFWGYITSSAAPLGMLADLVAAAVNPNVGAWILSPMATQIEVQALRWIAELIGFPGTGGVLVSGGNVANFVGLLAARRARATWDIRSEGLAGGPSLTLYASGETHTWVQKAADLFGFGARAIRWIATDADQRMDVADLERQIQADRAAGHAPFLVIGTAGSVGTGAVDPLPAIAEAARRHGLWFHVDGAYGAPAACLPEAAPDLRGLAEADSVALDPHKWLYAPLEAGCLLVRDPQHLEDAFSFRPPYYQFDGPEDVPPVNFHERGLQNSRGFRALKVWLGLRQAGREGYVRLIRDDIALAEAMHRAFDAHPECEARTRHLSIVTFRYVPLDLTPGAEAEAYLDDLNRALLDRLQQGGEAFVSNAVVDGTYLLRACVVNFHTKPSDVEALAEIVVRVGRALDAERRPLTHRRAHPSSPAPSAG